MIEAFGDKIIAVELEHGIKSTDFGIIIPDDDGKDWGIKSRWCKVFKVGPENKHVKEGQWMYVEHGRWSSGFKECEDSDEVYWYIDNKCILAVADEKPEDKKY